MVFVNSWRHFWILCKMNLPTTLYAWHCFHVSALIYSNLDQKAEKYAYVLQKQPFIHIRSAGKKQLKRTHKMLFTWTTWASHRALHDFQPCNDTASETVNRSKELLSHKTTMNVYRSRVTKAEMEWFGYKRRRTVIISYWIDLVSVLPSSFIILFIGYGHFEQMQICEKQHYALWYGYNPSISCGPFKKVFLRIHSWNDLKTKDATIILLEGWKVTN